MPKLHRSRDLRIIPQDTADAMIATKPTYQIGDCQSELNIINEAERKMNNIDGDFSITDWYDELEPDKRLKITEESPIFLLMHARDCGNLQINMGVEIGTLAIQSMQEQVDEPIQMLLDAELIEEVYPEDTELPLGLYEHYQEMVVPRPTPYGRDNTKPHFMQMLFPDHFSDHNWEENMDMVINSLPHDNEVKAQFINQRETIMNFIKLVHDYDNIFTTIYKNQDNG